MRGWLLFPPNFSVSQDSHHHDIAVIRPRYVAMTFLSLLPRQANPSGFFDNPGAGPRKSWAIETTQNITYSTVFSSYTIALWQQNSGGGGAELGPIVLGTASPTSSPHIFHQV